MRNPVRKLLVLALLGSAATVAAAHSAGDSVRKSSDCPHARAQAAAAATTLPQKWRPTMKVATPPATRSGGGIPGESSFFSAPMRDLLP
jgi:hypothetical protein